jgi:glycogen operon protein
MQVWPGRPYPLGATYDGVGTNFALFSEVAERVELCLFDATGDERRIELREVDGYIWHGAVTGIGLGQRYGYRVHGPYDPAAGRRCNPSKLLLDPYAKAIDGDVRWDPAVYSYPLGGDDLLIETTDSAPYVPRSVVTNPWFDWGDDRQLRRPWHETVVYTAVELMPIHQFVHDHVLVDRGLTNYWGYNSIGFFAPHNGYSAWGVEQVGNEFRHLGLTPRCVDAGTDVQVAAFSLQLLGHGAREAG